MQSLRIAGIRARWLNMSIERSALLALFLAGLFFLICLSLFPYYTEGDQYYYRLFYDGVKDLSLHEAFELYNSALGSMEPGYFFFVYSLSSILDKDILFSITNFFLAYLVFLWLMRVRVSFFIVLILCFNFYLMVLFFSAERLKLSIIFYMLSFYCVSWSRYFFLAISLMVHLQIVFLLVAAQSSRVLKVFISLFKSRIGGDFFVLIFFVVALIVASLLLRGHILNKLNFYFDAWGGLEGGIKPALFMLLAAFYAKRKWPEALAATFPVLLASFFIGSERLTMMSYFIFMYYGLQFRHGLNVGVISTSIYFAFKGVFFLLNVISHGDGFYIGDF